MINFSFLYLIPTNFIGLRAKGLILAMKQRLEVFSLSLQRGIASHIPKKGKNMAGSSDTWLATARATMAVRRYVAENPLMKKGHLAKRAISCLARLCFQI